VNCPGKKRQRFRGNVYCPLVGRCNVSAGTSSVLVGRFRGNVQRPGRAFPRERPASWLGVSPGTSSVLVGRFPGNVQRPGRAFPRKRGCPANFSPEGRATRIHILQRDLPAGRGPVAGGPSIGFVPGAKIAQRLPAIPDRRTHSWPVPGAPSPSASPLHCSNPDRLRWIPSFGPPTPRNIAHRTASEAYAPRR
jgi:hypothetical protein